MLCFRCHHTISMYNNLWLCFYLSCYNFFFHKSFIVLFLLLFPVYIFFFERTLNITYKIYLFLSFILSHSIYVDKFDFTVNDIKVSFWFTVVDILNCFGLVWLDIWDLFAFKTVNIFYLSISYIFNKNLYLMQYIHKHICTTTAPEVII